MKTITPKDLDLWEACGRYDDYSDERLMRLTGKLEWTPLEISRMAWVPCKDRLWVLLRVDVLGDDLYQEAWIAYVDRAVRKHALGSCIDEWARRWLSGEDRSRSAAAAAGLASARASACTAAAAWAVDAAGAAAAGLASARAAAAYAAQAARVARAANAACAAQAGAAAYAAGAAAAAEYRWQLAWLRKRLEEVTL